MERRDWALLAIDAGQGQPLSPVQLQKSLFMLGRNLASQVGWDFYEFNAYDYGPFDVKVYQDVDDLVHQGLVYSQRQPGRSWNEFAVTPLGATRAHELAVSAPQEAIEYLRAIVKWAQSLSFSQLVSAIYRMYPEQRANSVFR
jgi:hypothetical protein